MLDEGVPYLRPVDPAELRDAWVAIRERVAALVDLSGEPMLAEDVFHELLTGNATLWALDDRSGFVIFRLFATNYERTLFVWFAHNDSDPTLADYLPQALSIAEANDCNLIRWDSPRRGFERALAGAKVRFSYSIEVGG
jgi:hypothetical protein